MVDVDFLDFANNKPVLHAELQNFQILHEVFILQNLGDDGIAVLLNP